MYDLIMELSKLLIFMHLGGTNISNNPMNKKHREITA